jgi:hypothetical protein
LALTCYVSGQESITGGVTMSEFAITHDSCAEQHDPAIEKILQSRLSGGTVEINNISTKNVTAYIIKFTTTRSGTTEHHGAIGRDYLGDSQLRLTAGQSVSLDLWPGKAKPKIDVYPCAVLFDDGTGLGAAEALKLVKRMRADHAKWNEAVIAVLQSVRDSENPKAALLKRTRWHRDRKYFEIAAATLTGDRGHDQKHIDAQIAALSTQRALLLEGAK